MNDSSDKEKLFERIVTENSRRLQIIARNNARGEEAKDLEQEILLALWKSLDRYEGRSGPTTWFYSIAINTATDYYRKTERRERASATMLPQTVRMPKMEQEIDKVWMIEQFTQSLGEPDRNILLMYLDELSYREMSEAINLDEASLKMRVMRIKRQFAARYNGS